MPYKFKHTNITITAALAGIVILGVLCFALGNMRDILFGAPLAVHTAKDGSTLSDGFLPIEGNAHHAHLLQINGRDIFLDRAGNFTDGVILSPGYNVVEIVQQDRFGKQQREVLHLVLSPTGTVAQVPEMNNYKQ